MRQAHEQGRGHHDRNDASEELLSIARCKRCGRGLSSEASIDRGLGLVCFNKQRGDREQEDQDKQKSLNDFMQG